MDVGSEDAQYYHNDQWTADYDQYPYDEGVEPVHGAAPFAGKVGDEEWQDDGKPQFEQMGSSHFSVSNEGSKSDGGDRRLMDGCHL